ncbi:unnamed protein product [Hydatigera taeniaeformis]|uniref:Secreted protein n=1 Tax=Hydatigena taeniaeformis TaxID=6205 RepID=A0A0R3X320_HYDTA|nr:unnamed protein product [Hydatigera taeniaeformis]
MFICFLTVLQASTAGVGSTLVSSLSYGRYPVCQWGELSEVVRGIISTRVLQAPLPLHVLLTWGDERPWRRLQLADSNCTTKTRGLVEAIPVEVWFMRGPVYCRFVFAYFLTFHQTLLVEQSSVELIAAHLRLHAELRCCDKCSTVLPNSPLAVDAPDAQQHRCSSLVVSRSSEVILTFWEKALGTTTSGYYAVNYIRYTFYVFYPRLFSCTSNPHSVSLQFSCSSMHLCDEWTEPIMETILWGKFVPYAEH